MSVSNTSENNGPAHIGSRAVKVAGVIFTGKIFSFILLAASFIIVVRILGPSTYGVYTLAIAVTGFFDAVGNFGIGTALNKFVTEYKSKKDYKRIGDTISNGLAIILITGTILTIATFLTSSFFASQALHSPQYTYVIEIASISILVMMLFGAANGALVGFGNGRQIATSLILVSIIQSALSIVLALLGLGSLAPIFALIFAYLIGFFAEIYYIFIENKISFIKPTYVGIKRLFKFSIPIAAANFLRTVMSNASLIILGIFATAFVIGNFGVASKTGFLINIITDSISISLISAFSSSLINDFKKRNTGRLFSYSVYLSYLVASPMLFAVMVLSKPISYTAFGSAYTLAPIYIAIFGLGFFISIFGIYASQLLISASMLRSLLKYNIIISISQILLALIFIPILGGLGAAITLFLATPLITSVLFAIPMKKTFNVDFRIGKIIRITFANMLMGMLFLISTILLPGYFILQIVLAPILTLALYPMLLGILKCVNKNDIKKIGALTDRLPIFNKFFSFMTKYVSVFI